MPQINANPGLRSSLSGLLQRDAAAGALGPSIPAEHHRRRAQHTLAGEPANVKREVVLTASTDAAVCDLVELCRRAMGAKLTASHVVRALIKAIAACRPGIERSVMTVGRLKLPSNAKGREGEREDFEQQLTRAFLRGLKATGHEESSQTLP